MDIARGIEHFVGASGDNVGDSIAYKEIFNE
jgi:hypothetical protein